MRPSPTSWRPSTFRCGKRSTRTAHPRRRLLPDRLRDLGRHHDERRLGDRNLDRRGHVRRTGRAGRTRSIRALVLPDSRPGIQDGVANFLRGLRTRRALAAGGRALSASADRRAFAVPSPVQPVAPRQPALCAVAADERRPRALGRLSVDPRRRWRRCSACAGPASASRPPQHASRRVPQLSARPLPHDDRHQRASSRRRANVTP